MRGPARILAALIPAAVATAQIVTDNAGVASPELPALREVVTFRQARNVDEIRLDTQWIWSPSPTFETRTTLPFVWRDLGADAIDGFGDVAVRGKQSLWQHDDVLSSTRLAALGELSLPTGDDDDRGAQGVLLPVKLQPGSGATGFGGGAAFTLIRDRHRFASELFYRHTLMDDGFAPGDRIQGNLAYWYRLLPARFRDAPERDLLELRGVLELLTTHRCESHATSGLDDQGTEVWLAPGLQFFGRGRVLFEASLQVPVFQDVGDVFGRRQWAATIAIKFLF
ncbi:MAG: hypothetical protein WAT39_23310 [Planctomycetota bacterium]